MLPKAPAGRGNAAVSGVVPEPVVSPASRLPAKPAAPVARDAAPAGAYRAAEGGALSPADGERRHREVAQAAVAALQRSSRHATVAPQPQQDFVLDFQMGNERYIVLRAAKSEARQLSLSPREQEIIRMVALGYSNKIIADVLSISTWTVCTHLRRIFAKAGVSSRAAMVARLAAGVAHAGSEPTASEPTATVSVAAPAGRVEPRRTSQPAPRGRAGTS